MSTEGARTLEARDAWLLAYFVTALLALAPCTALVAAVDRTVAAHPLGELALHEPGGALLLESLASLGPELPAVLLALVGAVLFAFVLGPFVTLYGLLRIDGAAPRSALRRALTHLLSALLLSACLLVLGALLLSILGGVGAGLHFALRSSDDPRLHDLVLLVVVAAIIGVSALLAGALDLARAALIHDASVLRALRHALTRIFSARALPFFALYLVAQLGLALGCTYLAAVFDSGGLLPSALILTMTQLAALTHASLRGRWLARAHALAPPSLPATNAAQEIA